jgi:hypothetical protein
MYVMTYSVKKWGESGISLFTVATDDWVGTFARVCRKHDSANLAIVWMRELSSLEKRRLDELNAAGVEAE